MRLDIPFFSQLDLSIPQDIQRSSCAIVCLKMILDFKEKFTPFLDLQKEANLIGQKESVGWGHETIVRLLRNRGINAYKQEFFGQKLDIEDTDSITVLEAIDYTEHGLQKIKDSLQKGNPIMVSVTAGFSQDSFLQKSLNTESHVVVISGFQDDYFFVHDPIFDAPVQVTQRHFIRHWRKLAIFTE